MLANIISHQSLFALTCYDNKTKNDFITLLRYQKTQKRLAFRASILLLNQHRVPKHEIAARLGTTNKTVTKWINRVQAFGTAGLTDLHRSGHPRIFNVDIQSKVIYLATHPPFEQQLKGFSTISSELISWVMAKNQWVNAISRETVRKILRYNRLRVHRVKYWKTSNDPNFLEKMRIIVDLYLNPPPGTLIICVDEMPTLQALERIEHQWEAIPGKLRRIEFEYKRHGTTNLFAAFNTQDGQVYGETKPNKKHADFLAFMKNVDGHWNYPNMKVIVDNYKTHNHHLVKEWIAAQNKRIEFILEMWFGILRRYSLKHASFKDVDELNEKILDFIVTWNKNFAHPFKWKFKGW